jgi:hypothetical protein
VEDGIDIALPLTGMLLQKPMRASLNDLNRECSP